MDEHLPLVGLARAGVHTFLPMLHFSAPTIGGGVRGDGGLDRGCSIEVPRVRDMEWPPAKTCQVLVLLAHGWTLGCAKAWWHMFGGWGRGARKQHWRSWGPSSIAKNPDGAWGSGAHASTARHMAFCVQHRWSTDAEVGYKWPCPQRRCWRVEQKVLFGAWPSVRTWIEECR